MFIEFSETAQEDFLFWEKSGNKVILKKIINLLKALEIDPINGIGKPEKLKYKLSENGLEELI